VGHKRKKRSSGRRHCIVLTKYDEEKLMQLHMKDAKEYLRQILTPYKDEYVPTNDCAIMVNTVFIPYNEPLHKAQNLSWM
jgi:hypothetical protein